VKFDTANWNPARIWKIPGTICRKSKDTAERPHRTARIEALRTEADEFADLVTTPAQLEALAAKWAPAVVKPKTPCSPNINGNINGHGRSLTEAEIAEALTFVGDVDDRARWLEVGMALKSELGEHGRYLWDDWSETSSKYDAAGQEKAWRSIEPQPDGGITLGTLLHYAKLGGWPGPQRSHAGARYYNGIFSEHQETPPAVWKPEFPEKVQPVEGQLPDVEPLTVDMLPGGLGVRAVDVAERMGVPVDYIAIPMVVAAGALIGHNVAIRPKKNDDEWIVWPNLWGASVGEPGKGKSPAEKEAIAPAARLEEEERKNKQLEGFNGKVHAFKLKKLDAEIDTAVKKDEPPEIFEELKRRDEELQGREPRRIIVNDPNVATLNELFKKPVGLLLNRDELSGWLAVLDREGSEGERQYYLERWEPGSSSYTQDRIIRGSVRAENSLLSITGGFTPEPLATYLFETFKCGSNDGLIQRFQLLAYSDDLPYAPLDHERSADAEAKEAADNLFRKLFSLKPDVDLGPNVNYDASASIYWMKFASDAQNRFDDWLDEQRKRALDPNNDEHPGASRGSAYDPIRCTIAPAVRRPMGRLTQ
jgi:Protein of unknown function (DUF3987)/Primase C terminal 2 (PriCT-2)